MPIGAPRVEKNVAADAVEVGEVGAGARVRTRRRRRRRRVGANGGTGPPGKIFSR